jgi:hypothetical protein
MRHFTAPEFWQHFNRLPAEIQLLAKKDFELLKDNPRHPSLRLKKAGKFWMVRVGIHYRAITKERTEGAELVLDRPPFGIRQAFVLNFKHRAY